ncbi:MAG: MAPEG family protein [Alcanivorax sp.]|nr:MAPEG family protein [Alcanivorax sp.]
MSEKGYLKPPEEIDMAQAERSIRVAGLISVLALAGAVPAAYFMLPALFSFPEELPERLAFAAQASIFVLLCAVVAIGMVSTARRFSPEDIGGSAARAPSKRIAIYVAFLQNTLEQSVIAVGLYFALAVLLSGPWLSLIVVGVIFFLIGRVLFFRGYSRGVEGRALGMTLTMMPTAFGYLLVLVLMGAKWI